MPEERSAAVKGKGEKAGREGERGEKAGREGEREEKKGGRKDRKKEKEKKLYTWRNSAPIKNIRR